MQVIAQISREIQNVYLEKMQYDSISEFYKMNGFEEFWCGKVEDTCTKYLDSMDQKNRRILQLKEKLDEQVYELYHISFEERRRIEEEFCRDEVNTTPIDSDRRNTKLTREEKRKYVLVDYIRTVAKRIMLSHEPRIYDRFELEQRIRDEILKFYNQNQEKLKKIQDQKRDNCGKTVISDIEHLLGGNLQRLILKGVKIGYRRFYLAGNGLWDYYV